MTTARRYSRNAFDISQPSLVDILSGIHVRDIQLPSFARDWSWRRENVHGLLETIALGHPMGFATLVDAISADHRPFSCTASVQSVLHSPKHLMLDGQQRFTAIYYACYGMGDVTTGGNQGRRCDKFYFDMKRAVNPSIRMRDAIFSVEVSADYRPLSQSLGNFTDVASQYEAGIVPTNALLAFEKYEMGFHRHWLESSRSAGRNEALEMLSDFRHAVVVAFERYKVSLQILKQPMSKASLCSAYELLNA